MDQPAAPAQPPRLLDQLRAVVRPKHYSIRTEDACADRARRFILYHGKRHPREMGVVERGVSASTQSQAKAALLFLYKEVLRIELPWLDELVAAKVSRSSAPGKNAKF